MAEDEIERLLREIDATSAGSTAPSAGKDVQKKQASPAKADSSGGGRVAFAVGAAAVLGVGTWFVGWLLPFTSAVSAGIGGAIAAFITAFVAGPPKWFSN